ncbi:MAG: hypothetical protein AB8U44_01095 [Aaplasma endosymbiont of Hyalomma asiaticum]
MVRGSRGLIWAVVFLYASSSGMAMASYKGPGRERAFVTGKVLSYMWLLNDEAVRGDLESRKKALVVYGAKPGYRDYDRNGNGDVYTMEGVLGDRGRGLNSWGANYDAVLAMGLRTKRDAYGTVYGADFSLAVPVGAGGGSLTYGYAGTGSRVFADAAVGNFSLGYQEGVESSMKVDVLGAVTGGGSSWGRYLRCFLRYADGVPFYMYPGLYSENLFRSIGSADRIPGFSAKFRDVFNSMPMRFSYVSPRIGGVSVGFSYSLSGYRNDLFRGGEFEVRDGLKRPGTVKEISSVMKRGDDVLLVPDKMVVIGLPRFDLGPVYKNILSAALRYDWEDVYERIKVSASVAGEYAKPKRPNEIAPAKYKGMGYHIEYRDLAAASLGLETTYGGLRVALSGGYIGSSGRSKTYVSRNVRIDVPYTRQAPSYYAAASATYTAGGLSGSVAYFVSKLIHSPTVDVASRFLGKVGDDMTAVSYVPEKSYDGNNTLKDFVLGLAYSVYSKGSSSLEVFANCHMFFTKHEFTEHKYNEEDARFEHSAGYVHKNFHDGVVAVLGLKYSF